MKLMTEDLQYRIINSRFETKRTYECDYLATTNYENPARFRRCRLLMKVFNFLIGTVRFDPKF